MTNVPPVALVQLRKNCYLEGTLQLVNLMPARCEGVQVNYSVYRRWRQVSQGIFAQPPNMPNMPNMPNSSRDTPPSFNGKMNLGS